MGAIVGGAIGSVVGMSVAPKKGEATRKYLKEKGTEVYDKARDFIEEHEEDIDIFKRGAKKKGNIIFRGIKKIFRKR